MLIKEETNPRFSEKLTWTVIPLKYRLTKIDCNCNTKVLLVKDGDSVINDSKHSKND